MAESIQTVGEFLYLLFPGQDRAEVLPQIAAASEKASSWLKRALTALCKIVEHIHNLPAVPGYEALLAEHGDHPVTARMTSHILVQATTADAKRATQAEQIVRAIRILAKPRCRAGTILDNAEYLLSASQTMATFNAFAECGQRVLDFVASLELAVKGDNDAFQRVQEIAKSVAPRLYIPRGRKVRPEILAHELLLWNLNEKGRKGLYTWNYETEDFTDPRTQATRLAFGNPDFDPTSAVRRYKRRVKRQTN
jgi:hypothetical protein